MSYIHPIGIDLGTTNSAVAVVTELGHTEMIPNSWEEFLTPSCIFLEDGTVIVGREARKAHNFGLENVASNVKREIGQPLFPHELGGRQLPPEVLEAYILKQLDADIRQHITGSFEVVVTVPAFFDESRRQKTIDAANIAGLQLIDIINEPTAAALAFGEQLGYLRSNADTKDAMRLLVYDLGGGTFDVTIIELSHDGIRTLATDGDVRLGGYDWDRRLRDYVSQKFEDRFRIDPRSDRQTRLRLTHLCEEAKRTLSARRQTVIGVDYDGRHLDVEVTRDALEILTADLLERTMHTTRQVMRQAKSDWSSIDRILLVGGSTRMPMVSNRLREESGIEPDNSVNPDEAVARGAAIFATDRLRRRGERTATLKVNVIDVNSHSLGIEGIDQVTGRKQNIIVIPKNSPLPIEVSQTFVTRMDGQSSVVIRVLEGDSPDIQACIPVGKAVLRSLPARLPQGHPIYISYNYGTDGRLQVRAQVAGEPAQLLVEFQRTGRMDDRRLKDWQRVVEGNPRGNRLDALLEEVFGDERHP